MKMPDGPSCRDSSSSLLRGKLDSPILRQLLGRRREDPDGAVSEMDWADPEFATSNFRPDLR